MFALSFALPHLLAIALGPAVALVAWRARLLTGGAALAAAALGSVTAFAGLDWVVLLLAFFGSSVALGRVGRATKRARTATVLAPEAGRRARQVLANGGVFGGAAALAVAHTLAMARTLQPAPLDAGVHAIALGALAAATADTWATEIGTWLGGAPRHVLTWRPLATGMSGGVTLAGTAASVAGAALLGALAVALGWPRTSAIAGAAGGVAGALADSVLGATLQAKRRTADGALTERARDVHGAETVHATGLRWLDNDVVNLAATVTGAVVALAIVRGSAA